MLHSKFHIEHYYIEQFLIGEADNSTFNTQHSTLFKPPEGGMKLSRRRERT